MKVSMLAHIGALAVALISGSVITVNGQRNLQARGVIPVTEVGCTGHALNITDVVISKEKMLAWDQTGRKVRPKDWHPEWYGTAVWFLCNCKYVWRDGIPQPELDEAQQLIWDACGDGQSGWVWSKPWEKSYNLGSTEAIRGKKPSEVCPDRCVWAHIRAPEDG